MADAGRKRWSASGAWGHLGLGLAAVLLFLVFHLTAGRLEVGGGAGWDGLWYARMLDAGWATGTVNTRLRPFIVWANTPAFVMTQDPVIAFDLMNFVYAGLLAIVLSMFLARYGAGFGMRLLAVICIALSNNYRLFAFYPVLIDLGAGVLIALALYLILTGPRWAAAAILILFGVHRDVRTRTPLGVTILTYLPAALVWIAVRRVSMQFGVEGATGTGTFLGNMGQLTDPRFVALFFYFLLTFAGGVSMLAAAQPAKCWRLIREEPEWVSYTTPLLLATALSTDIWRYLIPLLPVVAVVFALCVKELPRRHQLLVTLAVIVLTLWTQNPFKRMDTVSYFTDWFPYYIVLEWATVRMEELPLLWHEWSWRFIGTAGAMWALTVYSHRFLARGKDQTNTAIDGVQAAL
jgi:hypothetical protein